MTDATRNAMGDRRVLFCPGCGRRYSVPPALVDEAGLVFLCGTCETPFRPGAAQAEATPRATVAAPRGTVLVAHDSPAVCATVGRVLEEGGYAPRYVHDGARAVAAFDATLPDRPVALVLDVGIPELLAFQVISILKGRKDSQNVRIILLASVFEHTRYKRRPTSLHGADAYVELHHVPDRLGPLLRDLLGDGAVGPMRNHLPVERARAESLRHTPEGKPDPEGARAVARRLVSDVALYHEPALIRGLESGEPLGQPEVKAAMAEARQMFEHQVPVGDAPYSTMFDEALENLLAGLTTRRTHAGS